MTPVQLAAARRKLSFSEDQAAALVGPAAGFLISAAQWKSMERGDFPLPPDLADVMTRLLQWQESALAAASKQIGQLFAMHGGKKRVALVDYRSLDDWVTLPDRDALLWRPQCSVIKLLAKDRRVRLVPFDGPAYATWLSGRVDDESHRAAWAAER